MPQQPSARCSLAILPPEGDASARFEHLVEAPDRFLARFGQRLARNLKKKRGDLSRIAPACFQLVGESSFRVGPAGCSRGLAASPMFGAPCASGGSRNPMMSTAAHSPGWSAVAQAAVDQLAAAGVLPSCEGHFPGGLLSYFGHLEAQIRSLTGHLDGGPRRRAVGAVNASASRR